MGDTLAGTWCGRQYRFIGGGSMQAVGGTEKFDASLKVPTAAQPKDLKAPPKVVPPVAAKRKGTGRIVRVRTPDGPPGGVMPMVVCIVLFNALAFLALAYLFPKGEDGLRRAVWDADFVVARRAWWPDAAALLIGHVTGFVAWAGYVYMTVKRKAVAPEKN